MPLPAFLAMVPMAILGPTYAASQLPFILVGSIVPVLAWRLAADVAMERGVSRDRRLAIALGTGLTCAVYLHLVLFSTLTRLDDRVRGTGPWCGSADGAGLARPARRAPVRPAPDRRGRPPRPGGADPERGGLAGPHLGRSGLDRVRDVASGAGPAHRGGRHPGDARLRAMGDPQPRRLRQPVAGPGHDQRPGRDRHRHLCLERPPDPVALPGGRSGPAHRDARRRPLAQPLDRAGAAGLPAVGHRPLGPAVAGPRPRVPTDRPAGDRDVPRHQPALPGRDDVGHVPPRGRARPRRHRPVGHPRSGRVPRLARTASRLDAAGRLARPRSSGSASGLLFSLVLLPTFGVGSRETQAYYEELEARLAAVGEPLGPDADPVISNFPIWVAETARVRRSGCPTSHRPTSSTWRARSARGCSS